MPSRPGLVALALAAATTAGAAAVYVASGEGGPYARPAPPAAVGAYRDGGAPARDAAIEAVLRDELPRAAAHPGGAAALAASPAFAHRGALTTAWRALVEELARDRFDPAERRARIDVVSDQLAAANLGYYLDANAVAYRVDDVAFVRANRERERVLGLRRLAPSTPAAPGSAMLGMVQEELGDPVVLLDAVDDKVDATLVPVLGGAPFWLGDDPWAGSPGARALAAAAGAAVRRELVTALGPDTETLARATARCRHLVAASVRHHEAQHALDEGGRALAYPDALAQLVAEKRSSPFAVRARYELSAYASQLASDMWLPQLTLWSLERHAFRRSATRTPEQLVAIVVAEGLARRLGIPTRGPVLHGGAIDRERLAALGAALAERSTTELRTAAAGLWADLFGGKLPRIVDDP